MWCIVASLLSMGKITDYYLKYFSPSIDFRRSFISIFRRLMPRADFVLRSRGEFRCDFPIISIFAKISISSSLSISFFRRGSYHCVFLIISLHYHFSIFLHRLSQNIFSVIKIISCFLFRWFVAASSSFFDYFEWNIFVFSIISLSAFDYADFFRLPMCRWHFSDFTPRNFICAVAGVEVSSFICWFRCIISTFRGFLFSD